jgi:hypothetical protein
MLRQLLLLLLLLPLALRAVGAAASTGGGKLAQQQQQQQQQHKIGALPPVLNISLVPSCGAAQRAGASPACAAAGGDPVAAGKQRPWPWPHGGAPTLVNKTSGVALGDIRAVVYAKEADKPLRAQIWWRRRDTHPTLKAVIVTSADNVPITTAVAHLIEPDCGVVSFTPPATGEYYVYYLPYVQTGHYASTHFHWFNCTDKSDVPANPCVIDGVLTDHAPSGPPAGCETVDADATARVLRLESRASPLPLQQPIGFDAFHPMELTATETELTALRQGAPPFHVFMEPRENPIRMFSRVSASWGKHGEAHSLSTSATAGEYFTFQIGLWASGAAINDVSLVYGALVAGHSGAPIVPGSNFTCFNLGGIDPHGREFAKNYSVASGNVGSLWVGVQLPADAKAVGTHHTTLTLRANGKSVLLTLSVDVALGSNGKVAENAGLGDIYKMGRLSWLDSTLGIDETVTDGFAPVEVTTKKVGLSVKLGGCRKLVDVDMHGMIDQVTVDNNKTRNGTTQTTQVPTLASPVKFVLIDAAHRAVPLTVSRPVTISKHTDATVQWTSQLKGADATLSVNGSIDFDSYGEQSVTITAGSTPLVLSDIQLRFSVAPRIAKYIVGMSHGTGTKTVDTEWKWTNTSGDPMVWLGRIEAGIFLKLRGSGPDWEDPDFSKDYPTIPFIPRSWGGTHAVSGQFGCNISAGGNVVAYSGPRTLNAGESITYQFDLAVTPSKVLNMSKHFAERYYQISGDGYHSPTDMKAKGVTVATLHQGIPGQVLVNGSAGPSLVNPCESVPHYDRLADCI